MITPSNLFGNNVFVFDTQDNPHEIQAIGDYLFKTQETAQFGDGRYLLLFKPGKYDVNFNVGFYTEVMGLGLLPGDTQLSHLTVNAQWLGHNNATCNFWRSVHNLSLLSSTKWAVSQAAPMRRLWIKNDLHLHDSGYASGGFLADSQIDGIVDSGPQQQWFSRNDQWHQWNGYSWNMVFMGVDDQCADPTVNIHTAGTWPTLPYTSIQKTPIIREKPYLVWANNQFKVAVPSWRSATSGVSWKEGSSDVLLSLDQFYIATEEVDKTPDAINVALENGLSVLLTPGIYCFDQPIKVVHSHTIVMGVGYATIVATNGNSCLHVNDSDDIIISGLLFDAGMKNSNVLVQIGESTHYVATQPLLLCDLFFRVGGTPTVAPAKADVCLLINSSNVVGDHFWIWRADHGKYTKWDENTTKNGLIVNGNDVTLYGLFVEHFHQYNTIWNGERGRVYFFQNEIPYDIPYQADWMSHGGSKKGYAQYKVSDHVQSHYAIGLGVYGVFLHNLEKLVLETAIEVPNSPHVHIQNAMTMMIVEHGKNGPLSQGTVIRHIVNECGDEASASARLQRITNR